MLAIGRVRLRLPQYWSTLANDFIWNSNRWKYAPMVPRGPLKTIKNLLKPITNYWIPIQMAGPHMFLTTPLGVDWKNQIPGMGASWDSFHNTQTTRQWIMLLGPGSQCCRLLLKYRSPVRKHWYIYIYICIYICIYIYMYYINIFNKKRKKNYIYIYIYIYRSRRMHPKREMLCKRRVCV